MIGHQKRRKIWRWSQKAGETMRNIRQKHKILWRHTILPFFKPCGEHVLTNLGKSSALSNLSVFTIVYGKKQRSLRQPKHIKMKTTILEATFRNQKLVRCKIIVKQGMRADCTVSIGWWQTTVIENSPLTFSSFSHPYVVSISRG